MASLTSQHSSPNLHIIIIGGQIDEILYIYLVAIKPRYYELWTWNYMYLCFTSIFCRSLAWISPPYRISRYSFLATIKPRYDELWQINVHVPVFPEVTIWFPKNNFCLSLGWISPLFRISRYDFFVTVCLFLKSRLIHDP